MNSKHPANDDFWATTLQKIEETASIKINKGIEINFLSAFWYLTLFPALIFIRAYSTALLRGKAGYYQAVAEAMSSFAVNAIVHEKLNGNNKELRLIQSEFA